jgi:uncharacterized protein YndB with AHSA1/START domain
MNDEEIDMTTGTMTSRVENDTTLVLERTFDAPRELVFRMFEDPEHLSQWWGPRGWEVPVCTVDFRPGGVWHYCMKCMDPAQEKFFGMESWGKAVYREIVEPERLVYTDYFSDADGNENPDMPATEVTMDFIDLGDHRTKIVSRSAYVSQRRSRRSWTWGCCRASPRPGTGSRSTSRAFGRNGDTPGPRWIGPGAPSRAAPGPFRPGGAGCPSRVRISVPSTCRRHDQRRRPPRCRIRPRLRPRRWHEAAQPLYLPVDRGRIALGLLIVWALVHQTDGTSNVRLDDRRRARSPHPGSLIPSRANMFG